MKKGCENKTAGGSVTGHERKLSLTSLPEFGYNHGISSGFEEE
jgi:hypothetical protein